MCTRPSSGGGAWGRARLDGARLNEAMAIQVLVRIGPHSRVVRIESRRELVPTIRRSFADVPRVANACTLLVQIKDEDWGGEFVDLKEDQVIPDRSVLNVIPQVGSLKSLIKNLSCSSVFPWQGIMI